MVPRIARGSQRFLRPCKQSFWAGKGEGAYLAAVRLKLRDETPFGPNRARCPASFPLAFLGEASHLLAVLDFRITLEARNPARGCLQHYRVEAGTDLFGVWVVEISYGRIGTVGRSRSFVVRDQAEARHLAQSILKRRATAPRRIGVAYRILKLIDPAGWAGSYGSAGPAEEDIDRQNLQRDGNPQGRASLVAVTKD